MGATRDWLEGDGGDSVVLPGFQKLQREKQTNVSLPSRNEGEVRDQKDRGQGRKVPRG